MVMARSSVHRRDDTLDLVQVVPKVDKIILVFTTTPEYNTRNLFTGTYYYSHQLLYKHMIPGSYFSVKSKHVLLIKIKHGNTR